MGILRQYTTKHYDGLLSEKPSALPRGDTYYATDTGAIFRYDQSNFPILVNGELLDSSSPVESTGLFSGGVISLGAGAGEYSISDGNGEIVTNEGVKTLVSWTGKTNIIPANIGTQIRSYLAIDSNGNIVEQAGEYTTTQNRTLIVLGLLVHIDGINIFVINNRQHISYNAMSSMYDFAEAIGVFNISGNVFSGNVGGNLSIDKTVGKAFRMGSNYEIDINNPHERTLSSLSTASFTYVFNDNSNGVPGFFIDPANLDDGAGGLTPLSNSTKWSVQRIYSFTSNIVAVQRGTEEYGTLTDAIAGIESESYFLASSLEANSLLRGWLVLRKNATDLTDPAYSQFIEAPKFGAGGGSAGATTQAVDLQTAYINSTNPEITTDSVRGAISVKQGSGNDTDSLVEFQNGAGTVTALVKANGYAKFDKLEVPSTLAYNDDTAAGVAGLTIGMVYQTTGAGASPLNVAGILMIKQ